MCLQHGHPCVRLRSLCRQLRDDRGFKCGSAQVRPIRGSGNRAARRFSPLEQPCAKGRASSLRETGAEALAHRTGGLAQRGRFAVRETGRCCGSGVRVPRVVGWLRCSGNRTRTALQHGIPCLEVEAIARATAGSSRLPGVGIRELGPASSFGKPGGEVSFAEFGELKTAESHVAEETLGRARVRTGSTFGQLDVWVSAHDKLMARATGK